MFINGRISYESQNRDAVARRTGDVEEVFLGMGSGLVIQATMYFRNIAIVTLDSKPFQV